MHNKREVLAWSKAKHAPNAWSSNHFPTFLMSARATAISLTAKNVTPKRSSRGITKKWLTRPIALGVLLNSDSPINMQKSTGNVLTVAFLLRMGMFAVQNIENRDALKRQRDAHAKQSRAFVELAEFMKLRRVRCSVPNVGNCPREGEIISTITIASNALMYSNTMEAHSAPAAVSLILCSSPLITLTGMVRTIAGKFLKTAQGAVSAFIAGYERMVSLPAFKFFVTTATAAGIAMAASVRT